MANLNNTIMGIFTRKKTVIVKEPEAEEDSGRANIAKQINQHELSIERPAEHDKTSEPDNLGTDKPTISLKPAEAAPSRNEVLSKKYSDLKPETADSAQGKPFYEFKTTLKAYGKRSRAWYIWVSIFFVAVIGLNIYLRYYMSAMVLVLLATLLFVNANKKNTPIEISLYTNGLTVDKKFYPWTGFDKFWILYEPPALKQLHLKRRAKFNGDLVIELNDQHPLKIRDLLLPLVPEDTTKEENNIDLISRTFKL